MTRRKASTESEPAADKLTNGDQEPPPKVKVDISAVTVLKIFASLFIGWAVWKLGSYILLIGLATLIAVTLLPVVEWLVAKGLKRSVAHTLIIVTFVALFCVSIALVIPMVLEQIEGLGKNLPTLKEKFFSMLPAGGTLQKQLDAMLKGDGMQEAGKHLVTFGGMALGGLTESALVLVIAFYLMVDGPKIHQWVLAFFSRPRRAKLKETSEGISQVIFAYVWGQAITSALVAIFSFAVLTFFKVPGALMLSLMAAVFDVLPLLGFFLFTIPAFLLAMSVSPEAAYMVLGLYLLYHLFENYFIVPKVYGKRLRISTLTVLLALLAGGILAGVPGALVALPIVASYSVIERIWLTPYLHDGVAEKHEKLEEKEFGEKPA